MLKIISYTAKNAYIVMIPTTGKNMHNIRTEKIMKVENEYKHMIPERFIKEYGHIRF